MLRETIGGFYVHWITHVQDMHRYADTLYMYVHTLVHTLIIHMNS